MKHIHRAPHASWIAKEAKLSNKTLPGRSNKSLLPNFRKNWDFYLVIAIASVITVMCVISVINMY